MDTNCQFACMWLIYHQDRPTALIFHLEERTPLSNSHVLDYLRSRFDQSHLDYLLVNYLFILLTVTKGT